MRLVILGAGGYGRTVADLVRQSGKYTQILFLDDRFSEAVGTWDDFSCFIDAKTEFYPAIGDNEKRILWLEKLAAAGCIVPTLVHRRACVSSEAVLSSGIVVLPMAVIGTGCTVQRGCIINCGAVIDHDCVLEEGVHVGLNAVVKGENRLPRCMKVEAGQVIGNRVYPLLDHPLSDERRS